MSEVWISSNGVIGNGTQSSPFDGSNPDRLDPVLRSLPPGSVIHWLPGEFLTRGCGDPENSWLFKRGWKFLCSGIDSSVIKLVDADLPKAYVVVGSNYDGQCDYGEIRDVTLDANLLGQPGKCAAGGWNIYGSHILIERVKVKRWGTLLEATEGFAGGTSGGHPDFGSGEGNVVQNCFAVEGCPENTDAGGTAFVIFGADEKQFSHRAPTIRQCFVSGAGSRRIRGYTITGGIDGVIDDCVAQRCQFGYYADTSMNYGLTVKNCRFHDVEIGIYWNYLDRIESRAIEPRLDVIGNSIGVSKFTTDSRVGINLTGTRATGSLTFGRVKIHGNNIYPVGSPDGLAGISISRAGFVDLDRNVIELPENRIKLTHVQAHRIMDQYVEL